MAASLTIQQTFEAAVEHHRLGRLEQAKALYRQVIDACLNLAYERIASGQLDEAILAYRQVLKIDPHHIQALNSLGYLLRDTGQVALALESFRRAMLFGTDSRLASDAVSTLYLDPRCDPQRIREVLARLNYTFAEPLAASIPAHNNNPDPTRKLRVGYVSDFRGIRGTFLLPVLSQADRSAVQIYCYASGSKPDGVTAQCRTLAHAWRDIVSLSDDQAAQAVFEDEIDVLVDLMGHSPGNRLLLFARKPAPVQVCWLPYSGTTGIVAMDYCLTDPYVDSAVGTHLTMEQPVQLPTSICYVPTAALPVNELPAARNPFVTFGFVDRFSQVNDVTLDLWGRVLNAVPQARFVLTAPPGESCQRVLNSFRGRGVDAARVRFILGANHQTYYEIDVVLDSFPFNAQTATMDALWMGVPTVTRAGNTAVSRAGLSILSLAGLPEWVAHSDAEFVALAKTMCEDRSRLSHLRSALRNQLQQSPLMDTPRFARDLEASYRTMWGAWCKART